MNESGRPRNWKGQAFEASKLTSSSIHWDKFLVLIGIKTRDGVSPEDIGAVARITQQMGSHECGTRLNNSFLSFTLVWPSLHHRDATMRAQFDAFQLYKSKNDISHILALISPLLSQRPTQKQSKIVHNMPS